ncbi:MAG: polysaccharide biosynthesis tyrosine autokinase [Bacteroidota bacterium]
MSQNNIVLGNDSSEINLKDFARKIWEKKIYFILCIPVCMAFAYLYTKFAEPTYEIATSLLMDVNGSRRTIGSDPNSAKTITALEADKNLFNEIGIIKSFDLISKTLEELDFNISYYSKDGFQKREEYAYFPFVVIPKDSSNQLIDKEFKVEIISEEEFRLFIDESEFYVLNPISNSAREISQDFEFSGTFTFGQDIFNDYFRFRLEKPSYKVSMGEFKGVELSFAMHSIEDLTKSYIDKLDVAQSDIQASIIQMTLRGPVVQKEVDFLNQLTENYLNKQLADRKGTGSGQISFIKDEMRRIGDSLSIAERNLQNYRSRNNAIDLSQIATNSLGKLSQLESEKSNIELEKKYYNSLLEDLQDTSGIAKLVMPSTQGINDPALTDAIISLRKKKEERDRQAQFAGENSMDIATLDRELGQAREGIRQNIQSLVKASGITLEEKKRQIGVESGRLSRLPANERNLVKLERERDALSGTYNFLRQQLTKIEVAQANEMPDTQVIDAPRMQGDGPVAPQKMLIMLLGLLVGVFIPLGLIVLGNAANEQIKNIEQIEKLAGIQVASSIGHFGMDKYGRIIDAHKWKLEESFRDLSASLQFLLPNSQNNIIGVTSTIPGEGKTFCATNLGMNFAEGGKKILLVDTDLRNPSLVEDIERVKGKGLVNYLRGEIEFFNEIIYEHDEIENLHYIPTYPIEGNPHKLLTSPRLKALINDLRDEYDYIIFDSPPVGLVSDYLLISKFFDIHLFVVRRNYSKLAYLQDVDKIKQRGNLKNMYIIFNDVKDDAFKYGYSTYEYRDSRKLKDIKKKIKK